MFKLRKIRLSSKYNFLVLFFIVFSLIIFLIGLAKYLNDESNYIYVKIKVGQGLWWASTDKPNFWFVNSIKKGEKETDIMGRTQSEILSITHYPILAENTENNFPKFDIFVNLKLRAAFDKNDSTYTFKRDKVSVASPIEFQFPSVNITGTVIEISKTLFQYKYVNKTVYLISNQGYLKDSPYFFDNIQIGDKYFNGQENVFEVLDKRLEQSIIIAPDSSGRIYEQQTQAIQNIIIKAKVKLIEKNGQYFYGEEKIIRNGDQAAFLTNRFNFGDFSIAKIE